MGVKWNEGDFVIVVYNGLHGRQIRMLCFKKVIKSLPDVYPVDVKTNKPFAVPTRLIEIIELKGLNDLKDFLL